MTGFPFKSEGFTDDADDVPLLRGTNVGVGQIDWTDVVYWPRSEASDWSEYELRPGDIVIGLDRPFISAGIRVSRLGPEDVPSLLLQRVARIRAVSMFEQMYLFYLLTGPGIVHHLTPIFTGVSVPHVSPDQVASFRIPQPPLDEQRQIVAYLDVRCNQIDALIVKQEQLIATLREDRTATITQAVSMGLAPAVDLVQPRNSALPACPKHWTHQISLKRVAEVQTGLTLGKSVDPVEAVDLPYLRVANVQTSGVELDEVKTVAVHRSEVTRYLLRTGDVLMTEGGDIDKLGRGCVWSGEISPCIHQNHVFAVRCKDKLSSDFLVYLLDTAVARNYFFMTAKKTTNLASTNSTTLGAFTFSLPPRSEQDQIVEHLNERCAGLDALIAKANTMIAALREYRAALITDAVTGKIDVREAVA